MLNIDYYKVYSRKKRNVL